MAALGVAAAVSLTLQLPLLPSATAATAGITYDFEDGTTQGWKVVSGSFGQLISDRAFEHNNPSQPYTKQGKYFMSTLETPTGDPNDGYTGEVDSPSFVLTQPMITALVGGGGGPDTYLGVVDSNGKVLAKTQGNNSETMFRRVLDLSPYVGQTLHLALVDHSTQGWGHITLDDVHINQPYVAYQAFDFESGTSQGFNVVKGSFGNLVTDRDTRRSAPDMPYTKQGAYYLSTLESPNGSPDPAYTGELVSPDFVLKQPSIRMMIGGGSGPGEYVAVETTDGKEIWRGSGANSEVMQPRVANLSAYVGKTLRLRVVDKESTGPWGYIALDDVQLALPNPDFHGPGAVNDLASTHTKGGPVALQWTFPTTSGVSGYRIYRADLSSATPSNPTGRLSLLTTVPVAGLAYTDTSATAGGGYIYAIRSVDANGNESQTAYTIARPYQDLSARGKTHVYSGSGLTDIKFPVGPLGDGGLLQDGTGQRRNWQNFYPADNVTYDANPLPDTFFALRSAPANETAKVAALQTTSAGEFPAAPSMTMTGEYPLGSYTFKNPVPGLTVTENFDSPMVPGDTKNSSLPVAVYTFKITNNGTKPQKVSLLSTQQNAIGWDGLGKISGTEYSGYGDNTNAVEHHGSTTGVQLTKAGSNASMRLSTDAPHTTATASWPSNASLLKSFVKAPELTGPAKATSGKGQTVDAALATTAELAPGKSVEIPVTLRWWVPTASHQNNLYSGRYYTTLWKSAAKLDSYLDSNLVKAQALTKSYHDTLYASNLPQYVLDRASSGAALLHTPTAYWTNAGLFGGYEGYGCCDGMPPHVWEYNQNAPQLFPEIGTDMVSQWLNGINPDGRLPERPLSGSGGSAFDGQAGVILSAYRGYRGKSAKDGKAWLDSQWPHLKLAMDWMWKTNDPNRTGVTSGLAHNTLDTDFSGASSWTGSLYLAAANAASKMAAVEGDSAEATLLKDIFTKGSSAQDKLLWNGEYYREVSGNAGQSYGNGVAIDMLLGQWWSSLLNLGQIYPADKESSSLRTLYRDNFKNNFLGYTHQWRDFVAPTDSAAVMFTWPHNDKPANSVNYNDETMSGFEYSAAAAMIQNGLVDQGLAMVNAVNNRYDGVLRTGNGITGGSCGTGEGTGNPFGDDECGQWYSRSGSSWSIIEALQGLSYDGPQQTIGFAPRFQPSDHRSFFTAGDAWGLFSQTRAAHAQTDTLTVAHGPLTLRHLTFTTASAATAVKVTVGGRPVPASVHMSNGTAVVDLGHDVTVASGGEVAVYLTI